MDEPALAAINDVNKQLTETKSIETKIQNLTDVSSGDQIREKAPVILEKLRCGTSLGKHISRQHLAKTV